MSGQQHRSQSVNLTVTPRLVVLLGLFLARQASAQVREQVPDTLLPRGTVTITGTVRDSTGEPLAGAEIRLGTQARTYSDSVGAFTLRDVPARRSQAIVRRIGHQPATLNIVPAADRMRIVLDVLLRPTTTRLETVIVEGRAVDRGLLEAGFYRRERSAARGRFVNPEYLASFGGAGLTTLLRETPRVMVERRNSDAYASGPIAGGRCRLHVYVDGRYRREAMPSPLKGDPGLPLDQVVPWEDVYAVEIYPTFTAVPSEFVRIGPAPGPQEDAASRLSGLPQPGMVGRTGSLRGDGGTTGTDADSKDSACGAIVIWTKTFTSRQSPPHAPP